MLFTPKVFGVFTRVGPPQQRKPHDAENIAMANLTVPGTSTTSGVMQVPATE